MPPAEVRSWPARDVEELRVFHEFEPMCDPYWIGAQICHLIYSVNRGKGSPKLTIEDFMPHVAPAGKRRQSPEEMRAVFLQATRNCK